VLWLKAKSLDATLRQWSLAASGVHSKRFKALAPLLGPWWHQSGQWLLQQQASLWYPSGQWWLLQLLGGASQSLCCHREVFNKASVDRQLGLCFHRYAAPQQDSGQHRCRLHNAQTVLRWQTQWQVGPQSHWSLCNLF